MCLPAPLPTTTKHAAPCRRALAAGLWERAGVDPPPGVAPQQPPPQQQDGQQPGWPAAFVINSEEVRGEDHPAVFAGLRRLHPDTVRTAVRDVRRSLLGYAARRAAALAASDSDSDSDNGSDSDGALGFGMRQVGACGLPGSSGWLRAAPRCRAMAPGALHAALQHTPPLPPALPPR